MSDVIVLSASCETCEYIMRRSVGASATTRRSAQLLAPQVLGAQHRVDLALADDDGVAFVVDLCVEDSRTRRGVAVLDTRDKAAEQPSEANVQQVVAYATAPRCVDAFRV